ncbi:MAG TPA: glycosyltransferase family 9 protein [Solirubrobacteraceae bacterium]|nr:glycosyltransferase family 9 protein [Solirubrobacteraceae bacterium]
MSAGAAPDVLVLRALGLGDLLTAVPALRALLDKFAGTRIALGAPRALAPLVERIGPLELVDIHDLDAPLPATVAGAGVAVNLHGRGPRSHRRLLEARPGALVAFAHPAVPASAGGPPWRMDEHEVVRWCRMLAAHAIPADPAHLDLDAPERTLPPEAYGATLVHPGAKDAARRWPAERWAAVAAAQRRRGNTVLVTGSPGEVALARAVADAAGLPAGAVLAGRTDLGDLAALVAAAGHVACGDTGMAHLATALGTPSTVLFGPVPPAEWGPPADRPRHRALWTGGRGDPHATSADPGLLAIDAGDVVRALETARA